MKPWDLRRAAERLQQSEVPLDVVPPPIARHADVVEARATALPKAHPPGNAGGRQDERRAQRPVRRDGEVEAGPAETTRRPQPAEGAPFGAEVAVPDSASATDKLLGFLGRRP